MLKYAQVCDKGMDIQRLLIKQRFSKLSRQFDDIITL